jgi:hypothetical protein
MAPELSTVPTAAQDFILEYVNQALVVDIFGGEGSPKLRLARIYLAAHYGSLFGSGGSGAAGPVTSESAGGLSRSYGFASSFVFNDDALGSTVYGRNYLGLVRTSPARAPVVL